MIMDTSASMSSIGDTLVPVTGKYMTHILSPLRTASEQRIDIRDHNRQEEVIGVLWGTSKQKRGLIHRVGLRVNLVLGLKEYARSVDSGLTER